MTGRRDSSIVGARSKAQNYRDRGDFPRGASYKQCLVFALKDMPQKAKGNAACYPLIEKSRGVRVGKRVKARKNLLFRAFFRREIFGKLVFAEKGYFGSFDIVLKAPA